MAVGKDRHFFMNLQDTDTSKVSDTPFTDQAEEAMGLKAIVVPSSACRALERELAEKTNEVATPRVDELDYNQEIKSYQIWDLARELEREVARLRELLGKVLFELEKVPFQTPKLTAFTAHRLADRYREQLNQLTK